MKSIAIHSPSLLTVWVTDEAKAIKTIMAHCKTKGFEPGLIIIEDSNDYHDDDELQELLDTNI